MSQHIVPTGTGLLDNRYELQVDRQGLTTGLRVIKKCKSLGPGVLSFEEGELRVAFQDFSFTTPATGQWYGIATAPGAFFKRLAKETLPGSSPLISVSYQHGLLTIGPDSAACKWQAVAPPNVTLATDATLIEVLAVGMEHSPEHIQRSGLSERLASAESTRDTLLLAAATTLAPLGITSNDLRLWVDEYIRLRKGTSK